MPRPPLLDDASVSAWCAEHADWSLEGVLLKRSLTFANFSEAFAFMTRVAMVAERMDHHPEWSNVYNRVEIAITTHDAGGITELDTQFAQAVDNLLT